MFKKMKEWFGVGGVQKEINVGEVLKEVREEVVEKELDISEPVYTIVERVKLNPARLTIKADYNVYYSGYGPAIEKWYVEDTITRIGFTYTTSPEFLTYDGELRKAVHSIYNKDVTFSQDEVDYIIEGLYDILYEHFTERLKRLTDIKASRKMRQKELARDKMLKQWEAS